MKFNDAIVGLVVALLGAAVIAQAGYFPKARHIPYGPGFLPTILGVGLAICGVLLIVRGISERRTQPLLKLGEWSRSPRHVFGFALVLVCLAFYALFADDIGHFACSVLILLVLIGHLTGRWLRALWISILASIAIQFFFVDLLLVPLPWGVLEPYSGWFVWR
ncbi:MAG: tripartite tricarboxylate transporter TctB family protein [Alphaproteobacteria bacterium]|nr:tripartite tricarboxylate transporter TctB family protein [Alphaproteobacteria bacterium]